LNYEHKPAKTRDLKSYKFLHEDGHVISLKKMSEKYLKINVQIGEHSPVKIQLKFNVKYS